MARLVGLDYGKKRTGIAITDPMQIISSPLKTIPSYTIIPFLQKYLTTETIEAIIIGWPLQLNGKEEIATRLVAQFIRILKRYFPHIPIIKYDERYTSVIAKKSLLQAGLKRKKRQEKGRLDAISASLILRSYMNKKEFQTIYQQEKEVLPCLPK